MQDGSNHVPKLCRDGKQNVVEGRVQCDKQRWWHSQLLSENTLLETVCLPCDKESAYDLLHNVSTNEKDNSIRICFENFKTWLIILG